MTYNPMMTAKIPMLAKMSCLLRVGKTSPCNVRGSKKMNPGPVYRASLFLYSHLYLIPSLMARIRALGKYMC